MTIAVKKKHNLTLDFINQKLALNIFIKKNTSIFLHGFFFLESNNNQTQI